MREGAIGLRIGDFFLRLTFEMEDVLGVGCGGASLDAGCSVLGALGGSGGSGAESDELLPGGEGRCCEARPCSPVCRMEGLC